MKHIFTDKYYLNISQFIFRIALFVIIENVKFKYGQGLFRSFHYLTFFIIFLFSTSIEKNRINIKKNIFFSILIIIDIAETFSWYFMISAINYQAIHAIDFEYITNDHKEFGIVIIFAFIFVFLFNFLPFYRKKIEISRIFNISKHFSIILLFTFILSIIHDFNGNRKALKSNNNMKYAEYLKQSLLDKINTAPHVIQYDHKALKNLILIQLESVPNEAIKEKVTPNLYSLTQKYEYVAPIYNEPYTSWTTGGVVVTQCGIPQILPVIDWKIRQKTEVKYLTNIKCIPDILGSFGYKKLFGLTGTESVMGFEQWRVDKGYIKINQSKNDFQLFQYFSKEFLAQMDKDVRKNNKTNSSRYLVYIRPEDTHLPYFVPDWCKLDENKFKKYDGCFHCLDIAIGHFIKKFLQLKMYEHTLLVIYPDHAPFGANIEKKYKQMFILFPGLEKIDSKYRINEEITYYDFAPTILDLIGIKKYVPEFTFGRSIYNFDNQKYESQYSQIRHHKPDENDLVVIDNFLNYGVKKNLTKKIKFKCYIGITNKYYFSPTPCDTTFQ